MNMRRQFRDRNGVRLLAALLTEGMPAADVDRGSSALVGQREVHAAVTAERRAEEREERLVLVDRQQLPIALRPSFRREDETHNPDFGKEGFSHGELPGEGLGALQGWGEVGFLY